MQEGQQSLGPQLVGPVLGSTVVLLSWLLLPPGSVGLRVESTLLLLLSVALVVRSRRTLPGFVVSLFAAHALYSIVLCFYLLPERFDFPLTQAISPESLAVGLRLLWFIPVMLWNVGSWDPGLRRSASGSPVAFWLLVLGMVAAAAFGIDRTGVTDVYRVRITPIYEYTFLLVALAYLYMGKSRSRAIVLLAVCAVIIVQDAFYGGRATSVQIILVLMMTALRSRLNIRRVSILALIGFLGGTFIGHARSQSEPSGVVAMVRDSLSEGLLTSETASYAYYASLTHISAAPRVDGAERMNSFQGFVMQIFVGGQESLTSYVSDNFYVNVGGGVFESYFYFWGGPLLAAVASCGLAAVIALLGGRRGVMGSALLIVLLASIPRWLLYSPTAAFRPLLILWLLAVALGVLFGPLGALAARAPDRELEEETSSRGA